jgi:hypothetical protein
LMAFYEYGVNAYVVKPVSYSEFMKAVKQLGVFWATVNEPPPQMEIAESKVSTGNFSGLASGHE